MNWKLYSFVVRSEQRKKILSSLKKPSTPTEIAKKTKLSLPHVSRTLAEFKRRGLVECLTPEEKVGKVYGLKPKGRLVLKEL